MLTILIFFIVIGVLVLVHEAGHFFVAKWSGMKVEEFGFGFPPRVCSWRRRPGAEIEFAFGRPAPDIALVSDNAGTAADEAAGTDGTQSRRSNIGTGTVYSINAIPFGGFVKILGENREAVNPVRGEASNGASPRSFSSKPASKRIAVIVAGVIMNVLLAYVLLIPVNLIGQRMLLDENKPGAVARDVRVEILAVAPDSPAAQIGWRTGDRLSVVHLNESNPPAGGDQPATAISSVAQFQAIVAANAGKEIFVTLERTGLPDGQTDKTFTVPITPRLNPPAGQGRLGIQLGLTGEVKYSWWQAPIEAGKQVYWLTSATALGFYSLIKQLVISHQLSAELSGPIAIARYTGEAARMGLVRLFELVALISINLAILNILPFPALDGGRLLLIIIEKIFRRPVPVKVENAINAVGFALLILLMIYVTKNDVIKAGWVDYLKAKL